MSSAFHSKANTFTVVPSVNARTSTEDRLPDLLYPISTLTKRGYGSRASIKARIKRGEVPAVRVGNVIKIRDRDIDMLAVPVEPTRTDGGDAA